MIEVRKGRNTLTITRGAYEEIYRALGYMPVCDEVEVLEDFDLDDRMLEDGKIDNQDQETDQKPEVGKISADDKTEETAGNQEPETVDESVDLEKPLGEMSMNELREIAKMKNIDTKKMTTKKEVKDAILAQGGV